MLSDTLTGILVFAVVLGPLVYVTMRDRRRNQAERARVEAMTPAQREAERAFGMFVPLPSEEALEQLTLYLAGYGMTATGRVGRTATFTRQRKLDLVLLVVLFLLGVVPALIYALWVSREERFSVTATPDGEGSRLKFGGNPGARVVNRDTYVRFVRSAQAQGPPQQDAL